MRVIGLMSGTSSDGIDAAAADFRLDGDELILEPLGWFTRPYPAELQARLLGAFPPAVMDAEELCLLDNRLGQAFAEVAAESVGLLAGDRADLIVSHGQTLFHWVEGGRVMGTLQIGQPAWIAQRTGLPVVADLRSRDVAAGGQGAPLVSIFDVLLLSGRSEPTAALNLGGMANLTVLSPGSDPIAYDVGPGNVLIDAATRQVSSGAEAYDAHGRRAARGRIDRSLLGRLLEDPYYDLPPPKSTGREHFNLQYLVRAVGHGEWGDDLVATVTALTAELVARECIKHGVREVVASGGGTHNPTLMCMLGEALSGIELGTIDDLGVPADAKEAYAFCVLGFLTAHGLPGTIPSCTGAADASVLGVIVPGRQQLRLPVPQARSPASLRVVPQPAEPIP